MTKTPSRIDLFLWGGVIFPKSGGGGGVIFTNILGIFCPKTLQKFRKLMELSGKFSVHHNEALLE